jgi:hypothetical protein
MTLEELIRYYVSILVDVARVDGLYDMAELHQLQAATLTLFDSEDLTIDLSVDDEFLAEIIENPADWNEAIEVVSALDLLNRVRLFQQAVEMACADEYLTFDEEILITVLYASIFSEEEQEKVSQYLELVAQVAILEEEMFGSTDMM